MFERFTEGAIKVIMLSQEEARRMGHNFVGTEQLLLGVIGQRHGIGAKALKKLRHISRSEYLEPFITFIKEDLKEEDNIGLKIEALIEVLKEKTI